jgi:hypothetical protein
MLGPIARARKFRLRRSWLRPAIGVWFAASCATFSAAAHAKSFELTWSAPAECPDPAVVAAYVERDLSTTVDGATVVRANGIVTAAADGWYRVALELDTGAVRSSTRELSGASCESVSQAAALLVALAIRAEVEPAPKREPPPPPVPQRASSDSNAHARPSLAAGVATDLGTLPKPTVGLSVSGAVMLSGVRFEPSISYLAPQSGTISDRPGVGARFTSANAMLRACVPFPDSRWWLAPCLGGGADWTRAAGFGARIPQKASIVAPIGGASLLGGWDISSIISLRLELGAIVPLARPEFVVKGDGSVYRRSLLALRGGFGLELHF